MGCHYGLWVFTIYVLSIVEICTSTERKCNISVLFHCEKNEFCKQQQQEGGICKCMPNYFRKEENGPCFLSVTPATGLRIGTTDDPPVSTEVPPPPGLSVSAIAAVVLVPLLIFVVVGLIFAARRYQWLHRLRHFQTRRYDEVRIGQEDDDDDDLPIA